MVIYYSRGLKRYFSSPFALNLLFALALNLTKLTKLANVCDGDPKRRRVGGWSGGGGGAISVYHTFVYFIKFLKNRFLNFTSPVQHTITQPTFFQLSGKFKDKGLIENTLGPFAEGSFPVSHHDCSNLSPTHGLR